MYLTRCRIQQHRGKQPIRLRTQVENGVLIGSAWLAHGSARPSVIRYDGQEHAADPDDKMYTTAANTADEAALGRLLKEDGKVVACGASESQYNHPSDPQ